MERRLAAILAADVVGYSRLIRENEAGTRPKLRVPSVMGTATMTGLCQKICRTPRMMSAQRTTLITNTKRID